MINHFYVAYSYFWTVQSRLVFSTGHCPNLFRIHIKLAPIIYLSELSSWGAVNFEKFAFALAITTFNVLCEKEG